MSMNEEILRRLGGPTGTASEIGPMQGKITGVSGGLVHFTIEDLDGSFKYTAPWNHAAAVAPTVGMDCLVIFVGPGLARPWVVAWA